MSDDERMIFTDVAVVEIIISCIGHAMPAPGIFEKQCFDMLSGLSGILRPESHYPLPEGTIKLSGAITPTLLRMLLDELKGERR